MRIVFIGNFRAQFSTESDLYRTLVSMGHEVVPIQEDISGYMEVDAVLSKWGGDLLFWVHTNGWPWSGRDERWVRDLRIPTACFTLDLYRGLKREGGVDVRDQPNMKCGFVFTADGDPETQAWFEEKGVNHHWLPPAISDDSCYLADPVFGHPAFGKVVFVGSRGYHPEWPWRQALLEWLEKTYGDQFVHFDHSSGMRGHKLNELYASAAVVVGDSCFADSRLRYWSDRFPETLGRGGRLVFPGVAGLHGPAEFYVVGDFDSVQCAIEAARGDPRRPCVEWAKAGNTYRFRMQEMLDTIARGR